MSGNTIGVLFRVTTWGESHGPATGAVVDGCPPGIALAEQDIQNALDRRRPGLSAASSSRQEADAVEILSGVFDGRTTGTPISLLIRNQDAREGEYDAFKEIFRPGHGDFTYFHKYGIRDHRGGGRASGRETAARVAAGAIAGKIISRAGMRVTAYTKALGGIIADSSLCALDRIDGEKKCINELCCPDPAAAAGMLEKLRESAHNGDSLGGIVEIVVRGCPSGLGEPVFDKLDADLARALMSIGTVKGVEIGSGFEVAQMTGHQANDPMTPDGFVSNHAGGILAGISTGQDIFMRVACKPIASIARAQQTVDIHGNPVVLNVKGRHDVSVIPRIVPVCEAMVNIVLADHWLRQKAVRI
ncbi:MAG: chorismate synthase [Syntrophus sp. (in: bacteria)]|nr:chorismate synthase [Syntrophus sp. (in: bacteria)]